MLLYTFGSFVFFKTLPVSNNAHVDAFTSVLSEFPICSTQPLLVNLSLIKLSIVVVSGTLKSASAKHINEIPSSLDSPYSAKNTSIIPGFLSSLSASTNSDAHIIISFFSLLFKLIKLISSGTSERSSIK